jgi:hypothetical protein
MEEEIMSGESQNWLKLEEATINLDHIESYSINQVKEDKFEVLLWAVGMANRDETPYLACTGSERKCKEFCQELDFTVGAKRITVFEHHPCECSCGCTAEVNEPYLICEDCEDGIHSGDLKKDAA